MRDYAWAVLVLSALTCALWALRAIDQAWAERDRRRRPR